MKPEFAIELKRQALHALLGTFFLLLLYFSGRWITLYASVALLAIGCALSIAVSEGKRVPVVSNLLDWAERGHEKTVPGIAVLLFVGMVAVLCVAFPNDAIIFGALIVLTFGDSASTLVGKKFGKIRLPRNRTLEGTLAGIVVSFALLYFFLGLFWFNALAVAALGMLAEYLPVDDNVSIPLVSAIALALLL